MGYLAKCRDDGSISREAYDQLSSFADLILQWNPKINLTGMRSRAEIEDVLLGECILAFRALRLAGKQILDFGSGAGIPGLVWLMMEPTIQLTSLEIRSKKAAFQKEAARHLSLTAEIVCGRFPEAVAGRQFDVIATRAIRFDPKLWEGSAHLLTPSGQFIRFGTAAETQHGWSAIPISQRSSILTRQRST